MQMKYNAVIDIIKIIFALCIVALHTGFLLDTEIGFYIHSIVFRLGVPFFFFSSGYFLTSKMKHEKIVLIDYIKKLIPIYLILSFIYLTLNMLRGNAFTPDNILNGAWYIITGRSQSVMWFVGALITSVIILLHLDTKEKLKKGLCISFCFYVLGLLFNTYAFLISNNEFSFLYNFLVGIFENNSNVFFEGFIFVGTGFYLKRYKSEDPNVKLNLLMLVVGIVLLLLEVMLVKNHLGQVVNYEYYLSHLLIIPNLFIILNKVKIYVKTSFVRKLSSYIYYFHYAFIIILIIYNSNNQVELLNNGNTFYLITVCLTVLYSLLFYYLNHKLSIKNRIINYITIMLYSISFIGIIFSVMSLFNNVVWADEICSLQMIKNNFLQILYINANDVHPPLYYCSLKLFVDVVMKVIPNLNTIFLGKLFSFIPLLLLLFVINTKVRKKFGVFNSSLATFFIVFMPQLMSNYFEIRMYSWGMACVVISYLYMLDVVQKDDKKSWIKFTITTIIAVYIHFYSCLTMVFIYLLLLIYSFTKNKKIIKKILISGIVVSLSFCPWLCVIIKHLLNSGSSFWIPSIDFFTIVDYVKYVTFPTSDSRIVNIFLGVSLILSVIYTFIKYIKLKANNKFLISIGLLVLFLVVGIGILVSILINPLFVSRYMFFAIGIFWISFSVMFSSVVESDNKLLFLLIVPILIGIINLNNFIASENEKSINSREFYNSIYENINDGNMISNDVHVQFLFAYLFPDSNVYIYKQTNAVHMEIMYGNIGGIENLNNESKYYYIENIYGIDYKERIKEEGYYLSLIDTFSMDWYYINLYEVRTSYKND